MKSLYSIRGKPGAGIRRFGSLYGSFWGFWYWISQQRKSVAGGALLVSLFDDEQWYFVVQNFGSTAATLAEMFSG